MYQYFLRFLIAVMIFFQILCFFFVCQWFWKRRITIDISRKTHYFLQKCNKTFYYHIHLKLCICRILSIFACTKKITKRNLISSLWLLFKLVYNFLPKDILRMQWIWTFNSQHLLHFHSVINNSTIFVIHFCNYKIFIKRIARR